ncbi:MAG: LemA family protein [Bacillota bacterium]
MVYALLGLLLLIGIYVAMTYNGLITLRQRVNNAWSQVDVQLRRRYDLIPNLVNTVKGYASHERETFENITEARSRAIAAGSVDEQAGAENALSSALRSLFAVVENYPELKADTNFQMLQSELSDTESKIAFARSFYNDTVQRFNVKTQVFPANIVAGMFGFSARPYFEIEEATREPVEVEF